MKLDPLFFCNGGGGGGGGGKKGDTFPVPIYASYKKAEPTTQQKIDKVEKKWRKGLATLKDLAETIMYPGTSKAKREESIKKYDKLNPKVRDLRVELDSLIKQLEKGK